MMKMIQLRINLLLKLNHIQTTNLQIKIGNWKAEGLITYSTDQQIFKFNVISGNNQELLSLEITKSCGELMLITHHMYRNGQLMQSYSIWIFITQQAIHVS